MCTSISLRGPDIFDDDVRCCICEYVFERSTCSTTSGKGASSPHYTAPFMIVYLIQILAMSFGRPANINLIFITN